MVLEGIEKGRGIYGQENDGDGGAGKIRRGTSKRRWFDNIGNDLSERELSGGKRKLNAGISIETSTPHKSGKGWGRRRHCCLILVGRCLITFTPVIPSLCPALAR